MGGEKIMPLGGAQQHYKMVTLKIIMKLQMSIIKNKYYRIRLDFGLDVMM